MDIPADLFHNLQTSSQKKPTEHSDVNTQAILEAHGWLRSVAGAVDFDRAVRGIDAARQQKCGLLLTGEPGVGKTSLLRILYALRRRDRKVWIECDNPGHMSFVYANYRNYADYDVFLDDFGVEEMNREYGNVQEAVGTLLHYVYNRGSGRVFATTNLNAKQINEKYGGRFYDRLTDMCVVVPFTGLSKRERTIIK